MSWEHVVVVSVVCIFVLQLLMYVMAWFTRKEAKEAHMAYMTAIEKNIRTQELIAEFAKRGVNHD